MPSSAYDIVVQSELSDRQFGCRGFSGVPASRRCMISLVSSGSDDGRKLVGKLADELEASLLGSSPLATVAKIADADCPPAPSEMRPEDEPDRLKVLVLVGSADHKFTDLPWYQTWYAEDRQSYVMLALPPSKYEEQFDGTLADDERLLRRINAATWKNKIRDVVPAVLARAGITTSVSRVFISYRRVETLPVALQLFDRLTHGGFDVFLDRFSIPPGYDFQRRLTQELEDKSMVVLLESKSLKTSKWTQHEIDFAKRNRLGLIALSMPDVKDDDRDDQIRSIVADARKTLSPSDFTDLTKTVTDAEGTHFEQWPELTSDALEDIVDAINAAHANALFRRQERLRFDLVAAINAKPPLTTAYQAVGPLTVVYGTTEHLLWPITRPPEVEDFRSTQLAHIARKTKNEDNDPSRAIIVGPQAAQEPDRQQRLKWLRDVSGCPSFDEGRLADLVNAMVSGEWP